MLNYKILFIVVFVLIFSCRSKNCNEFLTESDIISLKEEFTNRYDTVFSKRKLCSIINFFDVIKEESNYYDIYSSNHYFKYFGTAYYNLSLCIVKNKEGRMFLFTDSFVEDFVEFNNNNVGLVPEVDFENFSRNPEIIEFNNFLSSIQETKSGFSYIQMLMKCFQQKGSYGVIYPIFQGPLYQPDLEEWSKNHLNFELDIDNKYDYFNVADLALARIIKKDHGIKLEFIRKVFPNEYQIMSSDVPPKGSDKCK